MEEESELMNKKNIHKYNQEEEPKIHGMPKSQLEKRGERALKFRNNILLKNKNQGGIYET